MSRTPVRAAYFVLEWNHRHAFWEPINVHDARVDAVVEQEALTAAGKHARMARVELPDFPPPDFSREAWEQVPA